MLRFFARWFGKDYDPCKSCEILKYQIELVNQEKRELLNMITNMVKPNIIPQQAEPAIFQPLPAKMPWTQKRRILEQEDRELARIREVQSKNDALEKEIFGEEKKDAS